MPMSNLERINGPRWARFMLEAEASLTLAHAASNPRHKRIWIEQASYELDRASEARKEYRSAFSFTPC